MHGKTTSDETVTTLFQLIGGVLSKTSVRGKNYCGSLRNSTNQQKVVTFHQIRSPYGRIFFKHYQNHHVCIFQI